MSTIEVNIDKIDDKDIKIACLSATFYWLTSDYNHHKIFQEKIDGSIFDDYKKEFYKFTVAFSVRRTIKNPTKDETNELEGVEVTNLLLEDLSKKNGFIDEAKNGDLNAVDKFLNEGNRKKWNNIVSCLGKFAALIKPETYAMYDTLAVKTMKELSNYRKSNVDTYKHYMGYFEALKREVEEKYGDIINSGFNNFEEKYSKYTPINKNKSIAREAYVNRMIDKLLWHKGNK